MLSQHQTERLLLFTEEAFFVQTIQNFFVGQIVSLCNNNSKAQAVF